MYKNKLATTFTSIHIYSSKLTITITLTLMINADTTMNCTVSLTQGWKTISSLVHTELLSMQTHGDSARTPFFVLLE